MVTTLAFYLYHRHRSTPESYPSYSRIRCPEVYPNLQTVNFRHGWTRIEGSRGWGVWPKGWLNVGRYRSRPISVKLKENLERFAVDRLCIIYESSQQGSRQRINYGSRTKSRETNLHPSKVNNTPFYPIVPRIRLHSFFLLFAVCKVKCASLQH